MSASRMIIFIIITVYLVGLGFMIPSINNLMDDDNKIQYDSTGKQLPQSEQEFTFVTSIANLPLWFNTIFLILPFVLWIIIGISFFVPTTNAGA